MRSLIDVITNRSDVSFAPKAGGGLSSFFAPQSGVSWDDQLKAMSMAGSVFAIVRSLSTSCGQTEWGLFEKNDENPFEREPAAKRKILPGHVASRLWANPNGFQTTTELVETCQTYYELTGETAMFVARSPRSDIPLELWALPPNRLEPVPHPKKFISGYIYTAPDGEKVPLDVRDIIRWYSPDPTDPYRGLGPVRTIMPDIEGARVTAEWNRNFFLNSAQPGGIIELPRRMNDTEFEKFRERWDQSHRGAGNAAKVAILTDAKWVDSKFTQADMQFTEVRRMSTEVICTAFAFPPSKLGIVVDVNRANAEAQDYGYQKDLVLPRLLRWRTVLNKKLLSLYGKMGEGVEFEFPNPVTEDSEGQARILKLKAESVATLVDSGFKAGAVTEALGVPEMEFVGRAAKLGGAAVLIDEDGNPTVIPAAAFPPKPPDTTTAPEKDPVEPEGEPPIEPKKNPKK